MVVVLKPLHDLYQIKRIVVSTYQSVSGAGKAPMDELLSQSKEFFENKGLKSKFFTSSTSAFVIMKKTPIRESTTPIIWKAFVFSIFKNDEMI